MYDSQVMNEREFFIPLPDDAALRVRYLKDRDGSQIKTPPMAFANNEDAFNFALRDLRTNYHFYIHRYWQWRTG